MKKAAFFSPYLDTLGGGERYFFSVIKWACQQGADVDLFWPKQDIVHQANQRFGLQLNPKKITTSAPAYALLTQGSFWERIGIFDGYDFVFFISDGSLPFLYPKSLNLVHFQVPLTKIKKGISWFLKKNRIHYFVYNSRFTQAIIQPQLGSPQSIIIYPPVDTLSFHAKSVKKEKLILAVGRFDQTMQAKRHDILISTFKQISHKIPQWKLILAGGTTNEKTWVNPLKKQAQGYPIEFITNPSWQELRNLYLSAPVFWHAAGFGIDPIKHPEKMEHFGITAVEALAAGCIPIVYNGGGLPEIIHNKQNGFLFSTQQQLADLTLSIINRQTTFDLPTLIRSADRFDQANFYASLDNLYEKHHK
ncbi:MAG: glycosyltransferase family 4 protein [bacterium]|nr:glycosyltransferase family 4 protein [bacterium]